MPGPSGWKLWKGKLEAGIPGIWKALGVGQRGRPEAVAVLRPWEQIPEPEGDGAGGEGGILRWN